MTAVLTLLMLAATLLWSAIAHAETNLVAEQEVLRALVTVRAQWLTEDAEPSVANEEKGTALGIGRQGDAVFYVTADHVLVDGAEPATRATVTLRDCPFELQVRIEGMWIAKEWKIALFAVELPDHCRDLLLDVHLAVARDDVADLAAGARGLPVKVLGRGVNDEITGLGNLVAGADGDQIKLTYPTSEGTSGGVVLNERGEILCVVQTTGSCSAITKALQAAHSRQIPTTFLGPHARIQLLGVPEEALVTFDNLPKQRLKNRYYLQPRSHDITIEAHGYQTAAGRFAFGIDGVNQLCADMERDIDTGWRVARWPVLGTGIALLAVGGAFGIAAMQSHSDFVDDPSRESFDRTNSFNTVADVTAGIGALALLGFGLGHVVWNASGESSVQACR